MSSAQLLQLLSHGHMKLCWLTAYASINERPCCLKLALNCQNMAVTCIRSDFNNKLKWYVFRGVENKGTGDWKLIDSPGVYNYCVGNWWKCKVKCKPVWQEQNVILGISSVRHHRRKSNGPHICIYFLLCKLFI